MYFNSLRFQLHVIEIHTIPMLALFDTTDFVVYTPHCFHSTIIIMQSDYVRIDGVMVDRVILEGRRDYDMPSYQASWHAQERRKWQTFGAKSSSSYYLKLLFLCC